MGRAVRDTRPGRDRQHHTRTRTARTRRERRRRLLTVHDHDHRPDSQQGAAVLLLDNTGHEEKDRTRGSSTSSTSASWPTASQAKNRTRLRRHDHTRPRTHPRRRRGTPTRVHVGDGNYSAIHQPELSERQAAVTEALLSYIEQNPGSTTEEIAKGIGIRKQDCRSQLANLETHGTGSGTVSQRPSQVRDRRGTPHTRKGWYLAQQSQLTAVPLNGTGTDRQSTADSGVPGLPSLKDGTGTTATHYSQETA